MENDGVYYIRKDVHRKFRKKMTVRKICAIMKQNKVVPGRNRRKLKRGMSMQGNGPMNRKKKIIGKATEENMQTHGEGLGESASGNEDYEGRKEQVLSQPQAPQTEQNTQTQQTQQTGAQKPQGTASFPFGQFGGTQQSAQKPQSTQQQSTQQTQSRPQQSASLS